MRGLPAHQWEPQYGGSPHRHNDARQVAPLNPYQVPSRDPYGSMGLYETEGADRTYRFAQTMNDLWRVVLKHKWSILGIVILCVALGTVGGLMQTPLYSSTLRMQIDRNVVKVVEGGNIAPIEGSDIEFLKTQYELLQSRALAERVVALLRLDEDKEFIEPPTLNITATIKSLFDPDDTSVSSHQPRANLQQKAARILMTNRVVRPIPGSRLVDITYSDPSPTRAQRIADAFGQAFITSNLDKRFEANSYAKTFLEDQIKQLKLRLEESEKKMIEFAEKEQIVVVNEKSSIAENNLASANATLGNLISERIKNEQLWKQTDNVSVVNLPQFLTNSVIETLRAKRKELSTDYQEKLETFKPSYPEMTQIKSKLDEIDRQIAAEIKTIKDSLKASYETSLQQETEMKGRIESLRTELLDLQKRSIQYNILKREVDTNRSLYDGLLQRFKEVDVAGGVGANNIFIVDKPLLPISPSSPNLTRIILLSLALGIGLSLASAYILEKMDQTIYSADQVEEISGLPMLGIIPKVSDNIQEEIDHPRSALSEAYRSLCTALQFASETGLPKSLLITSSGQGEGKSFTAMTIAKHFANLGLKVLLIDADLRKPSLHVKLETNNDIGLTNYLTGSCTPPETFQKTELPNLAFMASGPLPLNAADIISSPRFLSLMTRGGEIFNLIVIDGPPVLGLADAPLLANATAATIFVTAARQTKASMLRGAVKRLQMARGFIAGTVLTKFDALAAGYGYGYGYGYGGYGNRYGGYGYGHYGGGQPPLPTSDQPLITTTQRT